MRQRTLTRAWLRLSREGSGLAVGMLGQNLERETYGLGYGHRLVMPGGGIESLGGLSRRPRNDLPWLTKAP